MKQSTKQQWIVLSATALTLMLGAVFASLQAAQETLIWPLAVLLGTIWGAIGIWILSRARRRVDSSAKK